VSNGTASVGASVVNLFDVHGTPWPTLRYYYDACACTAEVQGPGQGTLLADKCVQSSSTGFQEIFRLP